MKTRYSTTNIPDRFVCITDCLRTMMPVLFRSVQSFHQRPQTLTLPIYLLYCFTREIARALLSDRSDIIIIIYYLIFDGKCSAATRLVRADWIIISCSVFIKCTRRFTLVEGFYKTVSITFRRIFASEYCAENNL